MDAGDVDITEESLPPLVRKNSTFGFIQFFFVYCNNGLVDIYELDENNHASVNRGFSGDVAALVKCINLYYSKKFKASKDDAGAKLSYRQYFNLPQFFECQEGDTVLRPCLA